MSIVREFPFHAKRGLEAVGSLLWEACGFGWGIVVGCCRWGNCGRRGVVVVQSFGSGSVFLRDWTAIFWLVASVVALFLSVSVFLPAIH